MAYTYNGTAQTGYMGNYYSDYNGTASMVLGLAARLQHMATSTHSYSPLRATVFLTAPLLQDRRAVRLPRRLLAKNSTGTGVPGFEGTYTVAGLAIVALALLGKRHRAK